jgi:hypothetical protein
MKKKLISTAISMAISGAAGAGTTISEVYDISLSGDSSSSVITVDDFDTNLGTLTATVLTYSENINDQIKASNYSTLSANLTTTASGSITFGLANELIYSSFSFSSNSDYESITNNSRKTFTFNQSFSGSETLSSANAGDLGHSGAGGTYNLSVNVLDPLNYISSVGTDLATSILSDVRTGNLTVAYSYDPVAANAGTVAEPGCLALLAGGVAGLGFRKTKRRPELEKYFRAKINAGHS